MRPSAAPPRASASRRGQLCHLAGTVTAGGLPPWPAALTQPPAFTKHAYAQRKAALGPVLARPASSCHSHRAYLIMVPGKLLSGVKFRNRESGEQSRCGPPGAGANAPDQQTSGVHVSDGSKLSELDHLVQSPCFKDETAAAPPTDSGVI